MLKRYTSELLLVCIVLVLFVLNYTPGTYLSGWDNLQTELAPSLAIKRAFFSVWQEYQSLGLLAGMAHAADLTRAVFTWTLSLILPQSFVRYVFHFSMVLIGSLGVLHLFSMLGLQKRTAFIGSLFYLFNFGTVQILFLPFEPFTVFYAFLPWEIWIFLQFVTKQTLSKKLIFSFLLINFLATPQAYAQQIFVAYILVLAAMGLGIYIKERTKTIAKRLVLAGCLLFVVNSFWLLPQAYFVLTSSSVVKEAKTNQLVTEDVLYLNKNKGDIKNVLSLTGFFSTQLDKNKQPLFLDWNTYRSHPVITGITYFFIFLCLLGLYTRSRFFLSFLFYFLLMLLMLANHTFLFEQLNDLLRHNSFINQIFRSPFTKFIIPHALLMSYLLANGTENLIEGIKKLTKKDATSLLTTLVIFLLLISAIPAFRGRYLSAEMKVKIPQSYFQAIDYFKRTDKNKRIALLPEYTFWGWFYHNWGYNGSGFLWYGIEQPIVSRTFDTWSNTSESYFWEMKTALEAEDPGKLEEVLEKYNVDYILYDRSVMPIISGTKTIQFDRIDELLSKTKKISISKTWGFLSLYTITHKNTPKDFVWVAKDLPNIGPAVKLTNDDTAYQENGPYITNPKRPYHLYYPFLDLTSQSRIPKEWTLGESDNSWYLLKNVSFDPVAFKLSTESASLEANLYKDDEAILFLTPFSFSFEKKKVTMELPKLQVSSFNIKEADAENCGKKEGTIDTKREKSGLTVTAKNAATTCFGYADDALDQRYGYLVKVQSKNRVGQRPFFYVLDKTKEQAYLEDRLSHDVEYYIIGARFQHGVGYNFSFQNNSLANIPSINTIEDLRVYAFPYQALKGLTLINKETTLKKSVPTQTFSSKKYNYYTYDIQLQGKNTNAYIVLNQSYHPGWKAYTITKNTMLSPLFPFLFGKELKEHMEVNNWANGWRVDEKIKDKNIIIVFLPQYLQYGGFFLLLAAFFAIFPISKLKQLTRKIVFW